MYTEHPITSFKVFFKFYHVIEKWIFDLIGGHFLDSWTVINFYYRYKMERISLDKNSGTSMIPVVFPQKNAKRFILVVVSALEKDHRVVQQVVPWPPNNCQFLDTAVHVLSHVH